MEWEGGGVEEEKEGEDEKEERVDDEEKEKGCRGVEAVDGVDLRPVSTCIAADAVAGL